MSEVTTSGVFEVPTLSTARIAEIDDSARSLRAEFGVPAERPAHAWPGREMTADVPSLHLEDVSAIPFVSAVSGVEEYQHRARVRARDGDIFAAVTPQAPGYEAYCRELLGLGVPRFVLADPGPNGPLAVADACRHGAAFDALCASAREHSGLIVHPYMAINEVWSLAADVHRASDVPVWVLGPTPEALWVANDKQHFTKLVSDVVGSEWVVETRTTADPGRMAMLLRDIAQRAPTVALKRTRCASATGNRLFFAEQIRSMSLPDLIKKVAEFLEHTEWTGNEEVLVVAWETSQISPSTQLWIPHPSDGMPRVEGVYEQLLSGPERSFVGSRPSRLPRAVNDALAKASVAVARALQTLGYAGRCSFDFILVGDPDGDHQLRFVECNGRWGGTSTPMHLVDRLFKKGRPHYRAQDFVHPELVGADFAEVARRLGDGLFDRRTGRGKWILYNVGPLTGVGKLDVIAIGETAAAAESALLEELPRALGLR